MQTERVSLPEHIDHPGKEQWAEIRTAATLRAGDKKAVDAAIRFKTDDDGSLTWTADDTSRANDTLLARMLVSWSYDLQMPAADLAVLDELPLDAYRALMAALEPHWAVINFKSGKTPSKTDSGSSASSSGSPDT